MIFTPVGDNRQRRYKFLVITETDAERRPVVRKGREYLDTYLKGQIIICEVDLDGGGIPIEVGTGIKPGKLDCSSVPFDLWTDAINYSYAVLDDRIDKNGVAIRQRPKRRHDKRLTMFRHKA